MTTTDVPVINTIQNVTQNTKRIINYVLDECQDDYNCQFVSEGITNRQVYIIFTYYDFEKDKNQTYRYLTPAKPFYNLLSEEEINDHAESICAIIDTN